MSRVVMRHPNGALCRADTTRDRLLLIGQGFYVMEPVRWRRWITFSILFVILSLALLSWARAEVVIHSAPPRPLVDVRPEWQRGQPYYQDDRREPFSVEHRGRRHQRHEQEDNDDE